MTREILIKCESALEALSEFLKNHRSIFDGCMVDFITKDIFDKVLKEDLQNELLTPDGVMKCANPGCVMPTGHKCRVCTTPVCSFCCQKLALEGIYVCNECHK